MSIENNIREIAAKEFQDYSYVFEDWNGASEVLDRVDLPAIICILPVGGNLTFKRGMVKDSEDVLLAFVDKVVRDADGSDNEEVYSKMKSVAASFVSAMNSSGVFEPVDGDVRYSTILEAGSSYFTGVFLELTVKELKGGCV